ncbi:MAG: tetratricopeptide repeat protein [Methanospirillum sp.]|uniref:serine/threonine-protein kinase n=1 Tax=Methanospirillum sp. TaxID=45200 RepID=UPI00237159AB|nr:serine/threonine-protein kinase [Methanospirillum sp.]MDD1728325.1 tetratricopeptide repeat protein [Methanospirillum sp.]
MTPNDPPTIRESTIPDNRRGTAGPRDITEYVEPQQIGPMFQGYQLVRQFPATGGEADIWLVQKDSEYSVLKHYRLGIEPKLEVLEKVSEISRQNSKHLIRIFAHGFDEETQRWFEIQEYARNGSLKDLIKTHQIGMVQFRTIIEEISAGLDALHRSGILHLDLKPANVLIRSLRPLNLILIDFGISTLLDAEFSRQITSTKGTPMYWAPEQLANVVGKEADFWALGVIGLEIFTRKHPFEGVNHNIILATLSTKGIQVPSDVHPKVAILLKGLLTRNPKKRWGIREVSAWLAGRQNIPVFFEIEQPVGREEIAPYSFRNEQYGGLTDLTYALISDPSAWKDARMHIGRGYLTRWLEKTEQYGQAVEIEKYAEQYPDEDERLLYLMARFNPQIPFTFLGKSLDVSNIAQYLYRYMHHQNDDLEKRIISMLFSGELNRIFRTFSEITGEQQSLSEINRMFSWLSTNPRGTDEKRQLYDFLNVLKEREEIGIPEEWDTRAVLKLGEIRERFLRHGYEDDSVRVETELINACKNAISSESSEPDLLVALASVAEEAGLVEYVSPCLKKASNTDIRIISLLFSKKKGIHRFKLYKQMRVEYETNLHALSSDPWREPIDFWAQQYFRLSGEKDLPAAMSVAERIIEMDKTHGEGWAMRGVCLTRLGRVKEAEFFLNHTTVRSSQNPMVWQILGELHVITGNFDEAERSFKKGLTIVPDYPGIQLGFIKLAASQKKYHQVIDLCTAALNHEPDNQGFLLQKAEALFAIGRVQEATDLFEQYLKVSPKHTEIRMCLARCYIKLKHHKKAEQSINILLEQGVTDPQVLRLKAYLLLIAGRIREALTYLDQTLQQDPNDEWTIRIKADAYLSLKEFGNALGSISQILDKNPENYQFWEKLGKILLSLGFYSLSEDAFKTAIDGGRKSSELCIQYGDTLRLKGEDRYGRISSYHEIANHPLPWRVSQLFLNIWDSRVLTPDLIKKIQEASAWYDQSILLGGDETVIANRKGIIACVQGEYEQAIKLLKPLMESQTLQPAYLTNLACTYVLMGDLDRGTSLFRQGISRFNKNAYHLDRYAGMYFRYIGDFETALDLINQAVQANSSRDPIISYHQYLIMTSLNHTDHAREVATYITKIDPWFNRSEKS